MTDKHIIAYMVIMTAISLFFTWDCYWEYEKGVEVELEQTTFETPTGLLVPLTIIHTR